MKEGLRFDWYEKQHHPFFEHIIQTLIDDCYRTSAFKNKSSTREQKLRSLVGVVVSSLYSSYYSLPFGTQYISYPLSPKDYKLGDTQKVNFNSDYAILLFKVLKQKKWISIVPGRQKKAYTRIRASGELKKLFIEAGLRWATQEPKEKSKLIILRDRKPNPNTKAKKKYIKFGVPVPASNEVQDYRDELYSFNQFLCQNCVSLNLNDTQLVQLGAELKNRKENEQSEDDQLKLSSLNFGRVQLRRIFSRGSMTKGGRFYGGWWQSLPSIYRGHILINNLTTVEVDYSGMSLRIFAALKQEKLAIHEDIYNLGFEGWLGDKDSRRKPVKTFVNAMLNDEAGNYRLSKEEQALTKLSHEKLKEALFKKYPWLEDAIHAGVGLETQFIDSQIAMTVMQDMMAEGILVLPIHDSFIVRAGFEQTLTKVMEVAYYTHLGKNISTSVDGTRLAKHFNLTKDEFKSLSHSNDDIINLADVDIHSEDSSVMDGYVSSWNMLMSNEA